LNQIVFLAQSCCALNRLQWIFDFQTWVATATAFKDQLADANAKVTLHNLNAGHGWANNGEDIRLSRRWLVETGIMV
jgi:hypothetical protein